MNNTPYTNIVSLINIAGVIEGRTKFQKMVYILKCKGGLFEEKFKYHHFGPFSIDLQLEIDDLVYNNILCERIVNETYKYSVSGEFESDEKFVGYTDLIKELNNTSIKILELTSTIFFLKYQEKITDKVIIEKKLKFLKPHLNQYINKAFSLTENIESFNIQ